MKLKLSMRVKNNFVFNNDYQSFQSVDKLIKYIFFEDLQIEISDDNFDAVLYAILNKKNDVITTPNKINILFSVENCSFRKGKYPQYEKYGDYGDTQVSIYFYNHIDKCVLTDKYIAIPLIYTQVDYFKRYHDIYTPSLHVPFSQKKFCIIATDLRVRTEEKNAIIDALKKIGPCDDLYSHKHKISTKSCYHSTAFLNVLQQYKFVLVCENSVTDGYITEKIFNCFFARSIPIYNGSNKIEHYFNKQGFINANYVINLDKIKEINENEQLFNEIINTNKINKYDDEDYKTKLKTFIKNILPSPTIDNYEIPKKTKCIRPNCLFTIHTNVENNDGKHCCQMCKNNGTHGGLCQKNFAYLPASAEVS